MTTSSHPTPAARLLNFTGTLITFLAIVLCLLLALPRFFGISSYTVLSGSMEPTIHIGTLVYAKAVDSPETLQAGDIIVFREGLGEVPVIHRITENHTAEGEFITKGDANAAEDLRPVPYQNLLGKEVLHVPVLGTLLTPLSSLRGKLCIIALILGGLLLRLAAQTLQKNADAEE